MSRTEYLQELADSLKTEDQWEFEIQYRGRAGWWGQPESCRWFGDEGEYLGPDWKEAEKTLRKLLG